MKRSFFQAAVVSILLYGCTTLTLTKRLEKKLDGNYTRMLRTILNKSWRQHPTKHQLYGHLPPITKTMQVKRTRHAGHCWRSRDELINDALLWTPTYGRAKAGRPARTYIQQVCEDTGCSPEDLPEAMNDREKWRERVRDIRSSGTTWWWWWYLGRLLSKLRVCFPSLTLRVDPFSSQSKHQLTCDMKISSLNAHFFIIQIYSYAKIHPESAIVQIKFKEPIHLLMLYIENFFFVLLLQDCVQAQVKTFNHRCFFFVLFFSQDWYRST